MTLSPAPALSRRRAYFSLSVLAATSVFRKAEKYLELK